MPICNEDVARVFAGLRATIESLDRTANADRFDFFVLSDSSNSDICTAEVSAWIELCKALAASAASSIAVANVACKRKSGNIDDFCRRWGKDYRYMIVLDADSVMSGECLVHAGAADGSQVPTPASSRPRRVRRARYLVCAHPAILDARVWPAVHRRPALLATRRIALLGPQCDHPLEAVHAPLRAGAAAGQRLAGGEILSHDFIEAALMRRAGWAVWIAYDLDGSYEEMPPNLLDELKRDRRWCHGNLMNFRLFMSRGMHPVHRAVFVTGVMAYLSAPLWFMFLVLSTGCWRNIR
jgi:membrane glycosyltransferase